MAKNTIRVQAPSVTPNFMDKETAWEYMRIIASQIPTSRHWSLPGGVEYGTAEEVLRTMRSAVEALKDEKID